MKVLMPQYMNISKPRLILILFFTLAGCASPPISGPSGSGVSVSLPVPIPPSIPKTPSGSGKASPSSNESPSKAPQEQKSPSGEGTSSEPRSGEPSDQDTGMDEGSKEKNSDQEIKKPTSSSVNSEESNEKKSSQNPGFGVKSRSLDLPNMLDTPESASSSMGEITNVPREVSSSRKDNETTRRKSTGSGPLEDQNEIPSMNGTRDLSTAEKVAILDAELDRGEGRFDQAISDARAEQRQLSRSTSSSQNSPKSNDDNRNPAFDKGLDTLDPSTGRPREVVKISRSKDDSNKKFPPPDDIPDAHDDDVTAKQLRDRAEREPDPEKRKVLWDRYRKYMGLE